MPICLCRRPARELPLVEAPVRRTAAEPPLAELSAVGPPAVGPLLRAGLSVEAAALEDHHELLRREAVLHAREVFAPQGQRLFLRAKHAGQRFDGLHVGQFGASLALAFRAGRACRACHGGERVLVFRVERHEPLLRFPFEFQARGHAFGPLQAGLLAVAGPVALPFSLGRLGRNAEREGRSGEEQENKSFHDKNILK